MDLTYNPEKRKSNLRKHGVDFEHARDFDFSSAITWEDDRCDYTEIRWIALGFLGERLHVLCFKETDAGIRIISFRKATGREVKDYENR